MVWDKFSAPWFHFRAALSALQGQPRDETADNKSTRKKLKCNIHVCFPHNSDTWSLNDYISARSSLGWMFLYAHKENCQTESLLTPDTFPHPLLCARRTGALPRVGFSGPSLVLSLIPCLVSVAGPAGCWQTDRPSRWAGPDVEGAESPTRPV